MKKDACFAASVSKFLGSLVLASQCDLIHAQNVAPTLVDAPTAASYTAGYYYGLSAPSPPGAPPIPVGPAARFVARGNPAPTITETGALPPGLILGTIFSPDPNQVVAELSGLPPAGTEGEYHIVVTASNGIGPDATLAFTLNVVDGQIPILDGLTGNWYDPEQSGHGFSIEVLPNDQMLAQWFVFAPDGGPTWITALGPTIGNTAILQASQASGPGGRFPPNFDASQVQDQPWGTIKFTFDDCNSGQVSWSPTEPGYSSGSIAIKRLTSPAGIACFDSVVVFSLAPR